MAKGMYEISYENVYEHRTECEAFSFEDITRAKARLSELVAASQNHTDISDITIEWVVRNPVDIQKFLEEC